MRGMLESEGWKTAKAKLDTLILDLQNINNLDLEKPLEIQLFGRKMAADIMFAWAKDLYGIVEQADTARASLVDTKAESYIDRPAN